MTLHDTGGLAPARPPAPASNRPDELRVAAGSNRRALFGIMAEMDAAEPPRPASGELPVGVISVIDQGGNFQRFLGASARRAMENPRAAEAEIPATPGLDVGRPTSAEAARGQSTAPAANAANGLASIPAAESTAPPAPSGRVAESAERICTEVLA